MVFVKRNSQIFKNLRLCNTIRSIQIYTLGVRSVGKKIHHEAKRKT